MAWLICKCATPEDIGRCFLRCCRALNTAITVLMKACTALNAGKGIFASHGRAGSRKRGDVALTREAGANLREKHG